MAHQQCPAVGRWAPRDDARVGRLTELELEVRHYHDRAAHAEKWLARIHQEIEEKFFGPNPTALSR